MPTRQKQGLSPRVVPAVTGQVLTWLWAAPCPSWPAQPMPSRTRCAAPGTSWTVGTVPGPHL